MIFFSKNQFFQTVFKRKVGDSDLFQRFLVSLTGREGVADEILHFHFRNDEPHFFGKTGFQPGRGDRLRVQTAEILAAQNLHDRVLLLANGLKLASGKVSELFGGENRLSAGDETPAALLKSRNEDEGKHGQHAENGKPHFLVSTKNAES